MFGILRIIILAILLNSLLFALSSSGAQEFGTVVGKAMDSQEAVMPGTIIWFVGEQIAKQVVVGENGTYQIQLAPGVYRIVAVIPRQFGFFPFERATVRIEANTRIVVNVVPVPEPPSDLPKFPPGTRTAANYESIFLPHLIPLDLVIESREKQITGKTAKYKEATMSYNTLTVYADNIEFNQNTQELRAYGKYLIIEDGKERFRAKSIMINFKSDDPLSTVNLVR